MGTPGTLLLSFFGQGCPSGGVVSKSEVQEMMALKGGSRLVERKTYSILGEDSLGQRFQDSVQS